MVKAYTSSAGSKEARESLAEASKGHKEYTEVSGQEAGKIQLTLVLDGGRNVTFLLPEHLYGSHGIPSPQSQSQLYSGSKIVMELLMHSLSL